MGIACRCTRQISRSAVGQCAVLIIAVYRVGSLVAAEVQLIDIDWRTACLLDVHLDIALDDTAEVVATEHLAEGSAGDGQLHMAVDVGIVRAGKHQLGLCRRHTAHDHIDILVDVGVLTGTDYLEHVQRTVALTVVNLHNLVDAAHDPTLLVAGTVEFVDEPAVHLSVGITSTIVPAVDTDIGTRVDVPGRAVVAGVFVLTVTAAEDGAEFIGTVNHKVGRRYRSGITAAVHIFYAHLVTTVYNHLYRLAGCDVAFSCILACGCRISRSVWCEVTAAIDGSHLVIISCNITFRVIDTLGMLAAVSAAGLEHMHEHGALR